MEKMSKKFHDFITDSDVNGIIDIISETNSKVAGGDTELQAILDSGVGRRYFFSCILLAENVIKSFENEDVETKSNDEKDFDEDDIIKILN